MPWTPESILAFEKIKAMLASSQTLPQREQAIRLAIQNGIPLFQIEALLDWLDLVAQSESALNPPLVPHDPGTSPSASSPIP